MLKADVTLLLQKRYFIITSSNSILNIDTFFVTNYTQKTLHHVYLKHLTVYYLRATLALIGLNNFCKSYIS